MKRLLLLFVLIATDAAAQYTELQFPIYMGDPYTCNFATEGFGYMNGSTHTPYVCNSSAWTSLFATSTLSGSGTTNKVAKWTSASTLGDSNISDTTSGVTAASYAPTTFSIGGYAVSPTPSFGTLSAPSATAGDTDKAGGTLFLTGGTSTGAGAAGTIRLQVSLNKPTGSTLNTLTNVAQFTGTAFTIGQTTINSGGSAPSTSVLQGYNATGTDVAGGGLIVAAGAGTGTGTSTLNLQIAPNAATGSGANALVTAGTFGTSSFTVGGYAMNSGGTTAAASTLKGVRATGTDVAGGAMNIIAGEGTGNGASGTVSLVIAPNSSTGSARNTTQTAALFTQSTFQVGGWSTLSGGTAPTAGVVAGVTSAGTDIAGGGLTLRTGLGTGASTAPSLTLQAAVNTTTGTTLQSQRTVATFTGTNFAVGNVTINSGGSAPGTSTMSAYHAAGTDVGGGAMVITGGQGTGTGAAGTITMQVAPNSTTGSTVNAQKTALLINQTSFTLGNVTINSGGAAAAASTVQAYNAAGTDVAGGSVSLNGGQSTGTGAGGAVTIKLSPNAATGSSTNALATAATFNGTSVTVGNYTINSGGTAPAASTFGGVNAAGTDIAGSSVTVRPGAGTGAAAAVQTNINRNLIRATGTTAQTSQHGFTVCETKILSNTSATTTTLATIGLASNTAGGAIIGITVTADNGTDFDSETQQAVLSFVNKAGVFTVSTPTITASSAAGTSGSTTIGFTATGASSLISLKVTPVFTTIVPTTVTAYIEIANHSAGAVACQ